MNLKNNPSSGIDLLDYNWVVRGVRDLQTSFKPEKEVYVKTREELDNEVNLLVSQGFCVFILPTHIVMENFDLFRSSINL